MALCIALFGSKADATLYTALVSGNFSSAATWGGVVPGSLLTTDAIVIPAGINVSLTGTETLSGTSSLTVLGTLSSTGSGALVMTSGTLSGTGTISVDSVALGLTSGFSFTGNLNAHKFTSTGANIASAANVTVNNALYLNSGTLSLTAGSLTMGNNSMISAAGGSISSGGTGVLHLDSVYNVTYTTGGTAGAELTGTGLHNIMVNTTGTVNLAANTATNGAITLTSGTLSLNGHNLTLNSGGDFSASGTGVIMASPTSSIIVNTATGLSGALRFAAGGSTLNNLTINPTASSSVISLGDNITINGILTLWNGTLSFNGHTVTIGATGDVSTVGVGTISGSPSSGLIVNSTAGLTGALRFAAGSNTLNGLTINTGSTGNVSLGSDLNMVGAVTLTNGTLTLGNNTLTFNGAGDFSASGVGTITGGTGSSNIVVNSTAGLTGALRFTTGGPGTIGNLTINTGSGSSVSLGTDLGMSGTLTLTNGTLKLNTHNLTFNTGSDIASSGTGTITGNTASNIAVNATAGLAGTLRFAPSANTINDLTINTGSTGNVSLGSDVVVNGMLTLTNGTLSLNGNHLTINSAGDLSASGSGAIVGSTTSGITVNNTLSTPLRFATGGGVLYGLTINTPAGGNVSTNSDLLINGSLGLSNGTLTLNGHDLTIASGGDIAAAGTGSIMSSGTSNITINSTAGLTGTLRFATGGNTVHHLTINTGAGTSAMLGNDLNVAGTLTLTNGSLALNGHHLTLASGSDLAASGTGTIMSSGTSNITVNNAAGLTGNIRFASGANTINNLTLNTGAAGNVSLGSDVAVNGNITISNGTLTLNGHTLTINSTGDLSATGTGTIMGSATSDLVVNSTASLSSPLRFSATGNILHNLTINSGGDVMLSSDLTTNGILALSSGTLSLNGHTLTLGAGSDVASGGTGSIMGSATSSLVINSGSGLTGSIRFASGGDMLNNLTVNTGSGSAALGSDLSIDGMLTLTAGSFSLNGHNLTLNTGSDLSATGSGTIMGSPTSNLTINSTSGLTGMLNFTTGANTVNNLTVNTGSAGNVSLGSDLAANGVITLTNGTLSLNGHTLTINSTGDLSASGTGTMVGSSSSNLVVNSTSSLSSPLRFSTGGSTLNNLTVNSGGNVSLNSDLTTNGMLNLTAGTLSLNGHTLTLGTGGDIATAGTGSIMGTTASNIVINSTAGTTGTLRFATSGNMLNDLTVNTGAGNSVSLGSDLNVHGMLHLQSGKVKLGTNNLNIATGGMVMGGSSNSYVVTNGTGKLTINLNAGGTDTFQVGSGTNYAPVIINANSGSASGDVSVNVGDGVLASGTTGASLSASQAMVNTTWYVSSTATSGINYNMTTMWSSGMEVNGFNRTHAYISHYTGGNWDTQTPVAAGTSGSMYTMTRTGITSLSPFMVTDHDVTSSGTLVTNVTAGTISIYPNPAANTLYVSANAGVDNANIYDINGKLVQSVAVDNGAINISALPAGGYMVRLTGKDTNVVKEFIKQ